MKKLFLLLLIIASYSPSVIGQAYSDLGPDDNYRSSQNPYYWKNRKPFDGYWQQDVHYNINAALDDSTGIITAKEELTYFNNSPDTLYFVFFHLYQNAFQPGSYLDNLQKNNDEHPHYGKFEIQKLGTVIDEMKSGEKELKTELENTILKVFLDQPLAPNDSETFQIKFKTYYDNGTTRRRMKKYRAGKFFHYNGCQWYPKICVYDRKFGWETDQHMNREFYGDFGSFDVSLTIGAHYIVEATGVLQNENEVLPDSLKKKLDITNFKYTKWDTVPTVIIKRKSGVTKTWKYHAENVHDFAFTADPTYRIHDTIINPSGKSGGDVRCVAIVQEPHASGWQNASEYLAKIISVFSRDFGVYAYPKIVVADAADGMEYPMLTLDGGKNPDYHYLLIHEVGHNWFYGMVGSNETYRAFLDEGFTQFLTAWGLEKIDGDTMITEPSKNRWVKRFSEPANPRDRSCYIGYLGDAIRNEDEPINTHSDAFNGALGQGGGYRHVYMKTATMLYNLQYVLGDSLFSAAMKHYVAQWKFAHPYPEDFRNSIIHFTHADLNWFFDEWMETTKKIDYKVGKIRKGQFPDQYEIYFKRKGRMQMPVDFRVISNKDSVYEFTIPNTWFEKKSEIKNQKSETLSRWIGWDKLEPNYTATVTIPSGIQNIIIDPSNRLADINMLNNSKHPKVELRFDSHIYPPSSWKNYRMWMRPDVWWNAYDGLKLGVHLEGNYMGVKHNFSLTVWVNTHFAQGKERYYFNSEMQKKAGWFSYNFSYSTAIDNIFKRSTFYFQSRWLDGYELYKIGIVKSFPRNFSLDINLKAFTRNREAWRNYLLYPEEWTTIWDSKKKANVSLNISATYSYQHEKVGGYMTAHLRSATLGGAFNYHYLEFTSVFKASVWKLDFRERVYARVGSGNDLPSESALYFAGGNAEEMMESKYYRAAGFVPASMAYKYGNDIGHLHFGGGLNMRGYSGYLLAEKDKNGFIVPAYKGQSGGSINVEMDFNRIVPCKVQKLKEMFNFNTYLFADAGVITYTNTNSEQQLSQFRFDAGVGAALTIKKWGALQNIKPLTFRFDVPFFISHSPFVSQKHFDFRWVIGVGRTF